MDTFGCRVCTVGVCEEIECAHSNSRKKKLLLSFLIPGLYFHTGGGGGTSESCAGEADIDYVRGN